MNSEETWRAWFSNYQSALERIARIAEEEQAEALAIGTELDGTTQRPEWGALIEWHAASIPACLLYTSRCV